MRLYIIRHADPDYKNHTLTPAGHRGERPCQTPCGPWSGLHLYLPLSYVRSQPPAIPLIC